MAENTRGIVVEPRPRMDGFTSTLSEYSTTLADMNQALEELQSRKERLQAVLEGKQRQTAKLRAQVEAKRVQERAWKEQENAATERIKQLNEELEAAKKDLEKTRARGEELRQLRLKRVSEFEEEMRELYSEFLSLRLLDKCKNVSKEEIAEELSQLQNEVAALEEEHALVAHNSVSSGNSLHLDTLQSILKEGEEFLEEMEKESKTLMDEEATLREQLEALQHKTDDTGLQEEDVHMTEQ